MMTHTPLTVFLRRVLLFDAATCLVTGIVLLTAAGTVEQLLEIPAALSRALSAVLLIFGAAVAWVGTRRALLRPAVWAILSLNALWAVESVLALALGWLEPNSLGRAFIIVQAAAVAVIAELQFIGLRRAGKLAV
ncbi:MAG TPA: hypothetical protein VFZ51_07650 [Woeseiaceae bacterium]